MDRAGRHLADFAVQEHLGSQVRQGGVALWRGKAAGFQLTQDAVVRYLGPEAIRVLLQISPPHQQSTSH